MSGPDQHVVMDDRRVGQVIRLLRQRKQWRQADVAQRAKVSPTLIARIERGALGSIPLAKIRRVADTLGAQLDTLVRWHGADLGRLLDARHAAMHEVMAGLLGSLDDWQFQPEVSFSIYGERGIIDILAWHRARGMLLVIELKTEIVEVSGLLGSMDRRQRLAREIAVRFGWKASATSTWVVVADSRTNRRTLAAHAGVVRSKMPLDGRSVRPWLRDPSVRIDAISFMPDRHRAALGRNTAPVRRIQAPKQSAH